MSRWTCVRRSASYHAEVDVCASCALVRRLEASVSHADEPSLDGAPPPSDPWSSAFDAKGRPIKRIRVVVNAWSIISVISIGLLAWLLIPHLGKAERDPEGEVAAAGSASVFGLRVGDCLEEIPDEEEISFVDFVPCDEDHDGVVYSLVEIEEDEYPDDEIIDEEAWDRCDSALYAWSPSKYDDPTVDFFSISPSRETWEEDDDRTVTCVALFLDEPPAPPRHEIET